MVSSTALQCVCVVFVLCCAFLARIVGVREKSHVEAGEIEIFGSCLVLVSVSVLMLALLLLLLLLSETAGNDVDTMGTWFCADNLQ